MYFSYEVVLINTLHLSSNFPFAEVFECLNSSFFHSLLCGLKLILFFYQFRIIFIRGFLRYLLALVKNIYFDDTSFHSSYICYSNVFGPSLTTTNCFTSYMCACVSIVLGCCFSFFFVFFCYNIT